MIPRTNANIYKVFRISEQARIGDTEALTVVAMRTFRTSVSVSVWPSKSYVAESKRGLLKM